MVLDTLKTRLGYLFRSAFTELSWWKKRLLQLAAALLVVGVGLVLWNGVAGDGESLMGSWTALRSGAGCLLGFLVGAAFRLFLKLGLLLGAGVAALFFGLSWLGWIELPWSSFGEAYSAVANVVEAQTSGFQEFVSGYLPSSGMTGLGLASGVTQRPEMDDEV